ncbi:general transcription factor II-I repeat domain-containing protein 2-like, partial [Hyposmocoma kahamanoa]|uniref:general transcription factor II-I repeat domain-containing protein 2-like n=1 Tax=Hyposmocoma kahamanoa TaxID=1477025 RepID=UPI000E6D75F5
MMVNDIKTTLTDRMAGFESFSIALDESTDLSDTAQLAIFIRGVDKEFTVTEELLALQPLKGATTGEDIFNEVQKVFTRFGLPWSKLKGVCIDGAPSMVGLRKGFIGILNEKATALNVQKDDLIVLHCIIHQQNLCSKSIRLQHVMDVVVKTINFIRSRGLNHRQFKGFLDEISAEYNDVTYYCEVRWLSKRKMLERFYELRNEIADFMKIKDKPLSELSDPKWICDLAFLVDLTGYLNDLNLKLQKQGQLVNDLYSHLKAFQVKLRLWESQMLSGRINDVSCPGLEVEPGDVELVLNEGETVTDSQSPASSLLEPDGNIGEEDQSPELSPNIITTSDPVRSVSHEDIYLDCE